MLVGQEHALLRLSGSHPPWDHTLLFAHSVFRTWEVENQHGLAQHKVDRLAIPFIPGIGRRNGR
jgi:hypothetical protein